jgi:hypothetical protein
MGPAFNDAGPTPATIISSNAARIRKLLRFIYQFDVVHAEMLLPFSAGTLPHEYEPGRDRLRKYQFWFS